MSPRANVYLQCVLGTGIFLLVSGLTEFSPAGLPQFFTYLSLAMLAATWKFRVPEVQVTHSAVFAFILIGIANYSLGETLVIGCLATLVQCLWRTKRGRSPRRSARKTSLSVAVVIIGITIAYNPAHFVLSKGLQDAPRMLLLAALAYFTVNSALVAGMIALVQEEPYAPVWRRIVRHSVLYHLTSGLIAALVIVANRFWGWQSGLLIVPLLYLTYRLHGSYLAKQDGEALL
jgi:hypothetical protein